MNKKTIVQYDQFAGLDLRVGTIIEAENFEKARNTSYLLKIDFGQIGVLKSSAQITGRYKTEDLIGKQVVAIVNFSPKQIATVMSECLVLGAVEGDNVTLLSPDMKVDNGAAIA